MKRIKVLVLAFAICMTVFAGYSHAQEGEEELFTTPSSVLPDALLLLDLSGSMNWPPPGKTTYVNNLLQCPLGLYGVFSGPYYATSGTGHTQACTAELVYLDPSICVNSLFCPLNIGLCTIPRWGLDTDTSCSGPYYRCPGSGHSRDCSRLAIAKRAIFDLLDDNDNNTINSTDQASLKVRVGYMRFYNCSDDYPASQETGPNPVLNYSTGCNTLIRTLGNLCNQSTLYSRIDCNSGSSCSNPITSCSSCVAGESATGGTPIASALSEAKLYLNANKAADNASACRAKFVILVTDGADTYACDGDGQEDQSDMYKRRKATVAQAKALADAGYKVFVIGFGSDMPDNLERTLNWAARYGNTDNPLVTNSGDPDAVTPSASPCTEGDTNDPGDAALSGYAFLASNSDDLATALKTAIGIIREATYSFAVPAVASIRETDENNLYQASFEPQDADPFWPGHLIKYGINTDGSLGSALWDAGDGLASTASSSRHIYTYKAGSVTEFTTSNISRTDLGVATDPIRNSVVGYIRGDSASNLDTESGSVLKLGDIFRSTPEVIGTPLSTFNDFVDQNNAFATFRTNHPRTSLAHTRLIVAGANDGQLHAFETGAGAERWSFIPPNLLPKLQLIAHSSHPTTLTHQYFVDGPVTHSDVWLGTGDGTAKSANDWKTYLVFGEGRGIEPLSSYLWSSSQHCDTGFRATYHATLAPYYCGYHALDLTDTSATAPVYLWHLNPTSSQAPYLGDPWGKVSIARVKIGDGTHQNEKWVGFLGGGYNGSDCSGGGSCDTRGKGFFIIDMANGDLLWSYTQADNANMDYSIVATPAALDTDSDGFVDTAYIGDLGGSMWRFRFCAKTDDATCNTTDWTGGLLFQSSTGVIRPIYTKAVASRDPNGNIWLYWGTGDKTDPTASNAQEKFFGLIDGGGTYGINDLDNLTSEGQTFNPDAEECNAKCQGWYMNLAGGGEKILAEPGVFGGVVYFTTYTPATGGTPGCDCGQAGTPRIYGVNYISGGGALYNNTQRSATLSGSGIPSAPIISLAPGGSPIDVIVNVSGGAGQGGVIITNPPGVNPQGLSSMRNIRYWLDRRVQ